MRYTLRGTIGPRTVAVTWENGTLSGDKLGVALVTQRAALLEGVTVGPPSGPYTVTNHLADALSAMLVIMDTLDTVTEWSGALPALPDRPGGIG